MRKFSPSRNDRASVGRQGWSLLSLGTVSAPLLRER